MVGICSVCSVALDEYEHHKNGHVWEIRVMISPETTWCTEQDSPGRSSVPYNEIDAIDD